jgi:hypothetical protein
MRLLGGCLLAAVMALSACSSAPTTGGGSSGSSGSTGLPIPPTTGGGGGGGATDRPSAPTAGLPTPSTDRDDGEADQDPTAGPAEGEADPDLGADADVDADAEVDAGTDIDVGAAGGVDQRFPEEPAMTAEERKEALARRLDQSLNDFDSTLEGEQRRTAPLAMGLKNMQVVASDREICALNAHVVKARLRAVRAVRAGRVLRVAGAIGAQSALAVVRPIGGSPRVMTMTSSLGDSGELLSRRPTQS